MGDIQIYIIKRNREKHRSFKIEPLVLEESISKRERKASQRLPNSKGDIQNAKCSTTK